MSFKITPVKEKDVLTGYKIIDATEKLEGILQDKGYRNRPLTEEELWVMGVVLIKEGFLVRFTMKKGDKTLVDMNLLTNRKKMKWETQR